MKAQAKQLICPLVTQFIKKELKRTYKALGAPAQFERPSSICLHSASLMEQKQFFIEASQLH